MLERLGLGCLQKSYTKAVAGCGSSSRSPASPLGVVQDRTISLDAKRSILVDWALTQCLMVQATGMEDGRPSRLHEVDLGLERANAPAESAKPARQYSAPSGLPCRLPADASGDAGLA